MQVSLAMNFLYMRQHSFWYCKGWIILIMLNAGAFQQVMDHIVVLIELIRMLPCGMRVPQQLFCSCVNNVLNGFWVNSRSSSAQPSSEFQVIEPSLKCIELVGRFFSVVILILVLVLLP